MGVLKNFRHCDFPEQIALLNRIREAKIRDAVAELIELYAEPLGDTTVDHLVTTTLISLLADNERETVRILKTGNKRQQALCIIVAGNSRFASAVPVLERLLGKEEFKDLYPECFFALGKIQAPQSLEIFRLFIHHHNDIMAALAIQTVGQYADEASVESLMSFLEKPETTEDDEICFLRTGMAVEALAAIKGETALCGLVSSLHSRNPTVRRLIGDALVKAGTCAVPYISSVFDTDHEDAKIQAANILGQIGGKPSGEILVCALDEGKADHPNVRFAVYEALGKISFFKGLIRLTEALSEEDEMILMAALTALNAQASSDVIAHLRQMLADRSQHSEKVIRILIAAKAFRLFKALYADAAIAARMLARIRESADPQVRNIFKTALSEMEGVRAAADLALLSITDGRPAGGNVLAVDDSKAMLSFYQSAASDMGLTMDTALNGHDAFSLIDSGRIFDLIIADMNMPVMDGLELTRKIRKTARIRQMPILMATTESQIEQRAMAQIAGVDAFITKPFTAGELQNLIADLLADQRQKREKRV